MYYKILYFKKTNRSRHNTQSLPAREVERSSRECEAQGQSKAGAHKLQDATYAQSLDLLFRLSEYFSEDFHRVFA